MPDWHEVSPSSTSWGFSPSLLDSQRSWISCVSPRVPHKCPFLRKEADISFSLWSSNWPSPRQQNRAVTSCRPRPIRSFESCASGALTRLAQWQDLGLVFRFVHQHFPEPGATQSCARTHVSPAHNKAHTHLPLSRLRFFSTPEISAPSL